MELFDIIKTAFKKGDAWEEVSKNDKVRNFFMFNRICSIQFPIQANQFNNTKISPRPVVDWWHGTLSNYYTKSPSWIFTKTKKSTIKDEKKVDWSLYEDAEAFIIKKFEVSKRELSDLKKYYPQKYEEWVKNIDTQIKSMSTKEK